MNAASESAAARAQAEFQQGLALHQQGQLAQARQLYRQVLELLPGHSDALHLSGVIAYQTGDPRLAAELISGAISANPANAAAHNNRGLALQALQRLEEALESYDRAARLKPDFAEAYSNRGNVLKDLGRLDDALESYDRAIALKPDFAEARNNRGFALQELGRLEEALQSYEQAIALNAAYAEAYGNRGNALQEMKRLDEALESYDQAIGLNPRDAEAYYNRGLALQALGHPEEALDSYDQAIALKPDYAEAFSNRGLALKEMTRLDEAADSYGQAIQIRPDFADAHLNLSLCRLLMGDLAGGWEGYEWRWRADQSANPLGGKRDFDPPQWLGAESLRGKTILLHSDQGLGDALQFCRYAASVAKLGARVVLEAPRPLAALLRGLDGVAQVVERGAALPSFDYHCPLMSLPLAFRTDLNSVPSSARYIAGDPGKVAAWRARLGAPARPRVGVVWRGSALHRNDRNRSIALETMLRRLPDRFQYVSLQKDLEEADIATLASRPDLLHFGDQLDDFTDTAALCELMDLVVSVDTSVAHLAGAMGRPVWILVTHIPDWRWLLGRDDSPWYPSARLFRQDQPGDWDGVFEKVRAELLRLPAAPSGSPRADARKPAGQS